MKDKHHRLFLWFSKQQVETREHEEENNVTFTESYGQPQEPLVVGHGHCKPISLMLVHLAKERLTDTDQYQMDDCVN